MHPVPPFAASPRLAACVLVGCAVLLADVAHGYECYLSNDGRMSVNWKSRQVEYVIHESCSQDLEVTECLDAIRASFQTWTDVDCSDFTFVYRGTTPDARAGYDYRHPANNRNLVVFREGRPDDPVDAWEHNTAALAMATLTYDPHTGHILDADIEVNGAPRPMGEFHFTVCKDHGPCMEQDIQNVVTHEVGHVVGLGHPDASAPGAVETTMYESAGMGEIRKRTLAQDDMDGMCAIYPAAAPTRPCIPSPRLNEPILHFRQTFSCDGTPTRPCPPRGCLKPPMEIPVMSVVLWLGWRKRRSPR